MKILQLINSLNSGGAEKLVTDLCTAYLAKGETVELGLISGHQTVFLDRIKEISPELKIHDLGSLKDLYHPKHIFKLRKVLRNYDVVHVHLFPALYWAGFASFFLGNKVKLLFTEHNTTNRRRKHPVLKHLDRFVYRRYSKIISISDAVDKNIREHLGKLGQRVVQINNGINLDEVTFAKPYTKKELGFEEKDTLLLQVSSFTPQKDQQTLIKSLLELPANTHLILVGNGSLKDEIETETAALNLADRVHFYGLRNDVPRLLKSVDIVVLSSNFEGLSLSCVEGLASGKPFVASEVPGLTEVVKGHGVVFPQGDATALAAKITELLNDKAYYEKVVATGVERSKQFDINDMVNGYLQQYRDTI